MLNGTADAARHIQLRRDDFASLADLPVVGRVARIYGGAAGTQRGTELVGQRGQHFVELLLRTECAATADNHFGGGEFGAVVLGDFAADIGGGTRHGYSRYCLDSCWRLSCLRCTL